MCLSYRQSIGLSGVSYLCQYSFFRATGKKVTGQSENLQKNTFLKISLFSITEQLFAKLLSHCNMPPLEPHIEVFSTKLQL